MEGEDGGGGRMEAEGTTNESRGLVGTGGGWQMGVEGTSNESQGLVGVAEGRWKLREPPTSREDSLVVAEGRWKSGMLELVPGLEEVLRMTP